MKKSKLFKILIVTCILFIFFLFSKDNKIIINQNDIKKIDNFDIIITKGQSLQSKILKILNLSSDNFTHVGFICKEKDKIYILHATPDGTNDNCIRYDNLQTFIDLSDVNYFVIIRSKNAIINTKAINKTIKKIKSSKVKFDYDFNNYDKTKLYCSELVYDIYNDNGLIKTKINLEKPIHPKEFLKLKEFMKVYERKSKK